MRPANVLWSTTSQTNSRMGLYLQARHRTHRYIELYGNSIGRVSHERAVMGSVVPHHHRVACSSTLVVWDVDNIMPPSEHALLQTLCELEVDSDCKVVLAANERTMMTLSTCMDRDGVVARVYEMLGVKSVDWIVVKRRKNAVDLILRDEIVRFARESTARNQKMCVCISNDGDFAGPLAYARYLGIRIVSIGTPKPSHNTRNGIKVRNASLAETADVSMVLVYAEDGTTRLHEQR